MTPPKHGPGPAKDRGPVRMPDPFVLLGESPTVAAHPTHWERKCSRCGHVQHEQRGTMIALHGHWCATLAGNTFVIWPSL